jgi:hypothetical protein
MTNIEKAIALLRENIATVPPHGCKRDEVLALLTADYLEGRTQPKRWIDTQQANDLPRENHDNGC